MVALAAATGFLISTTAGLAAGGDPNPGFGTGGRVAIDFGSQPMPPGMPTDDRAAAIGRQSTGLVVVAGTTDANGPGRHDPTVARLTSAGALDTGFGTAGHTTIQVQPGGDSNVGGLAVQNDDAVVVGGKSGPGAGYVARFLPGGALDTTFNSPTGFTPINQQPGQSINALAIQPADQKIVGVGPPEFSVFRLGADGAPDAGFDGDGFQKLMVGAARAESVLVLPDGKILVGGSAAGGAQAAVARLNSDGSPDTSFGLGGSGVALINTDGAPGPQRAVITAAADGKVLVASVGESNQDVGVSRLLADGQLDLGFALGFGITNVPIGTQIHSINAIATRPDRAIVVLGSTVSGSPFEIELRANGTGVTGFGPHGLRTIDFHGTQDPVEAGVLLADGSALLAGATRGDGPMPPSSDFGAYRLLPVLETTPPDTRITGAFGTRAKGSRGIAKVWFTGTDSTAPAGASLPLHFQCSIDSTGFATCASPQTFSLKPGVHSIAVRAIDRSSNADVSPAVTNVTIKRKKKKRQKAHRRAASTVPH